MSKFFKHPNAIVESDKIGEKTRIWAFVHILPKAQIGADCNICDHVFIENDVTVGDRVTIKSGVQLWDGAIIEDDVFIGPNATFTNDNFPRSKQYPEKYEKTIVKKGASIGANATVLCGITIGENAMIGAGAVVTRSVPPNAIVIGNPGNIMGYVDTKNERISGKSPIAMEKEFSGAMDSIVNGVKIFYLPVILDIRGNLTFAEYGQYLPFIPKRFFLVFDVPSKEIRGEHAHKKLEQFLVCIKGSCSVVVDNGKKREEILLDANNIGLYIPPKIWGIQYKYSQDAALLVFASDIYDPDDYIRNYHDYLSYIKE